MPGFSHFHCLYVTKLTSTLTTPYPSPPQRVLVLPT